MTDNETIRAQVDDDGIAVVTLARPDKRNALSIRLRSELMDTLAGWADDEQVRVVVLTGEGAAFSAGFDLAEFGQPELARAIRHNSTAYHRAVWSFPKPHDRGGERARRWAAASTSRCCATCGSRRRAAVFGHPEIKFGAPPLFTPLRWIVGDGIARDLCLTGRPVDADEALRIGLVSRVVAPDALLDEALGVGAPDRGGAAARAADDEALPQRQPGLRLRGLVPHRARRRLRRAAHRLVTGLRLGSGCRARQALLHDPLASLAGGAPDAGAQGHRARDQGAVPRRPSGAAAAGRVSRAAPCRG